MKQTGHLDTSVLHGDGTTTAAKKGGDNIGFSGHKKMKGDKVVTFTLLVAGFQNQAELSLSPLKAMKFSRMYGHDRAR